jgi:hypothetical protein
MSATAGPDTESVGRQVAHLQQGAGNRATAGLLDPRRATQVSGVIQRQTPGERMVGRSDAWLATDTGVKAALDVLRAALHEVKRGKSVAYNRAAGGQHVDAAATALGLAAEAKAELHRRWEHLVDDHKAAGSAAYRAAERDFFAAFATPLATMASGHPRSQAKFWLKNTSPQIADIIYRVADAELPAVQLYAYAQKEGLTDYVRDQLGLAKTDEPSKAQLAAVRTTKAVSGFGYLGLDDYGDEVGAKRHPLTEFLPPGFDRSAVRPATRNNEYGREVHSGEFPTLLSALQALAAMLERRRALFLEDAAASGYPKPTEDELVYWTYVYFNAGVPGGSEQLRKYRGKRKLGDWAARGEYSNAVTLLQSYQMLRDMKIF